MRICKIAAGRGESIRVKKKLSCLIAFLSPVTRYFLTFFSSSLYTGIDCLQILFFFIEMEHAQYKILLNNTKHDFHVKLTQFAFNRGQVWMKKLKSSLKKLS